MTKKRSQTTKIKKTTNKWGEKTDINKFLDFIGKKNTSTQQKEVEKIILNNYSTPA